LNLRVIELILAKQSMPFIADSEHAVGNQVVTELVNGNY